MKKTMLVILFTIALVTAFGASGGGSAAASDKTYNIVVSYYSSESIPPGKAILDAVEYAKEKSNGRLTFETYFSGTYVSKSDTMAALKTGQIDIAPVEATQIASVAVLNQVFNALIQSDVPDRAKVQAIYVKMIEDIPELNQEMIAAVNSFWLYPYVLGGYNMHGNKPIASFSDIKGLKIEAHGQLGEYVNSIGATAVELDAGEYYNGLKLGTVDSQLCHWAIVNNSQLNEVIKYHTLFGTEDVASGLNLPCMGYLVNKHTWDSLPPDLQNILKEAFSKAAYQIIESDAAIYTKAIKFAKENGHNFTYIKGDDRKPWAEAMQPILDNWFAQCKAAGYDGKAVYEKMIGLFTDVK